MQWFRNLFKNKKKCIHRFELLQEDWTQDKTLVYKPTRKWRCVKCGHIEKTKKMKKK